MVMSQRLKKWRRWVKKIRLETESWMGNRDIHARYLEIVKANPDIQFPSIYHEVAVGNYGSFIVMAIRRQLDEDKDVISLTRLLKEMRDYPTELSKDWFRKQYKGMGRSFPIPPESFADADFKRSAGKLPHFDPRIAIADLKRIEKLGRKIRKFANKQVAHSSGVSVGLTFREINKFIEEYEKILIKYILILTAAGMSSLTPVVQYDWEEIFTKPWIKKS